MKLEEVRKIRNDEGGRDGRCDPDMKDDELGVETRVFPCRFHGPWSGHISQREESSGVCTTGWKSPFPDSAEPQNPQDPEDIDKDHEGEREELDFVLQGMQELAHVHSGSRSGIIRPCLTRSRLVWGGRPPCRPLWLDRTGTARRCTSARIPSSCRPCVPSAPSFSLCSTL